MALIKFGALVTQASGKIGGQSFAKSPSGTYIKNIGTYLRSSTSKMQLAKNQLQPITSLYRTITPQDVKTWDAFAQNFPYNNRVGELVYHSAYAIFTRVNYNRKLLGLPLTPDAPIFSTESVLTTINLSTSLSKIYLELPQAKATLAIKMFCSPPLPPNNNQFRGKMRMLYAGPSTTFLTSTEITNLINDSFGTIQPGKNYFIQIFTLDANTGQSLGTFNINNIIAS